MAKLFISYSHKDIWAQTFAESLRTKARHDVFVDYLDIRGAFDWWDVICTKIFECDMLVFIASPDSVTSPFCLAEVDYALALNKPILPLMIRDCENQYPDSLKKRRIQFTKIKPNLTEAREEVQATLLAITEAKLADATKYKLPNPLPPRPYEPEQPTEIKVIRKLARQKGNVALESQMQARLGGAVDDTTGGGMPIVPAPVPTPAPNRLWIFGGGIVAMIALIAVIIAIIGSGGGAGQLTPEPTTQVAMVTGDLLSPTPIDIETTEPSATEQPTNTTAPSETPSPTITLTPTDMPTQPALMDIAGLTLQAEDFGTATQMALDMTATATLWTPTFTPDVTQTALLEMTQTQEAINTAVATLRMATQSAIETQIALSFTPTYTHTPTATYTPTYTPSPTPTIPAGYAGGVYITENEQWTPVEQDFDGVTMVLVPAGCFDMGSDENSDEQPIHQQCFDAPFWIDKYEVTNGQFAEFGGVAGRNSNWTGDDLPRESITWFEAHDYCENNRGGRLPTEREWEYAARGPNKLIYPWGNDFVADNVVYYENSNTGEGRRTVSVGSREGGVSWVGALDMSGNIWEWVSSLYVPYPYSENSESVSNNNGARVLRGGSWVDTGFYARSADRFSNNPTFEHFNRGFRCVRSQE